MLAVFDQRVDPAAVLASLRVRAGGAERARAPRLRGRGARRTRPSPGSRGRRSPAASSRSGAERELPADAAVTVSVGAGTPSAEGPRRTAAAQDWGFRTYGPFRVRRHECGWGGRCTPFDPWRVELTNPIDAKTLRKELVRVEPDLPGLKVEAWGDTLALRGVPRGRTTYRVSLSSEIADAFGQPLEPGPALAFAVGPAPAALFAPGGDFVVLDPAGGPRFPVHSVNHESLRVEAYAVGPEHWAAWQAYRQKGWRDEAATPPGRRVIDTTVRVGGEPDALTETRLDLAPAFEGGLGQAILVVRPTSPRRSAAASGSRRGSSRPASGSTRSPTRRPWSRGRATSPTGGRSATSRSLWLAARRAVGGAARPRSDASGLARLALGDAPAPLLVARRGKDVAILPSETGWWSEGAGWRKAARTDSLRFCVFDDRKMYRPGEEVRVKGWLRRLGAGPRGDVEALPASVSGLAWTLRDSQGNEVAKGQARVSGLGGFDLALKLPPTMNLGAALLQLDAAGAALSGEPAHARVPGAGVPPARVRGEGPGERGPPRRRRRRHRRRVRRLLRRRRPARRGGELARERDPGPLPSPEPRRLRLRDVRALVGARARDGRSRSAWRR